MTMTSLLVFSIVSVCAFGLLRCVTRITERASLRSLTASLSDDDPSASPPTANRHLFSPGLVGAAVVMITMGVVAFMVGMKDRQSTSLTSVVGPPSLIQSLVRNKLQRALDRAIAGDTRNAGIEASAYYQDTFSDSVAVFDLTGFTGNKTRMDVFRLFLDFADALQDEEFESVVLAYDSVERFKIDGDYFQKIGRERDWQNPAYTVRTFPENLRRMDGSRAYGQWTGGVIGVLKEQMEDFNDFHDKWYLDDYRGGSSTSLVSTRSSWLPSTAVVTKSEYARIRNGMSYYEVWDIIGAPGEELSSNVIDGVPGVMDRVETVMYSWSNDDGSNMNAMFQNGRMIQKAQFGLR